MFRKHGHIGLIIFTRADNNSLDRKFICDLVLQILAYVAEKECINIRTCQQQGIVLARQNKVKFGRPKIPKPDNWEAVVADWKSGKITAKKAMQLTGLKRSTFYGMLADENL